MPRFLTTLPLIAALALAQGALAQDSTEAAKPAEGDAAAAPATGEASTGEELSMGQDDAPAIVPPA